MKRQAAHPLQRANRRNVEAIAPSHQRVCAVIYTMTSVTKLTFISGKESAFLPDYVCGNVTRARDKRPVVKVQQQRQATFDISMVGARDMSSFPACTSKLNAGLFFTVPRRMMSSRFRSLRFAHDNVPERKTSATRAYVSVQKDKLVLDCISRLRAGIELRRADVGSR